MHEVTLEQDGFHLIITRLIALVFVAIWALIAIFYAKGKQYFRKPLAVESLPVSLWHAISVFIAYLGTYFFLMPIFVWIAGKLNPHFATLLSREDIQTQSWIYLIATAVALVLVFLAGIEGNRRVWRAIWGQRPRWLKNIALGFFSWFVAFPVVNFVGQLFGLGILLVHGPFETEQAAVRYVKMTMPYPLLFGCTIFAVIIVIPLLEELLFRGFLQSWLRKYMNVKWSIGCSALIFASFHFAVNQGLGNIELIPSLFVLACFLGYLFERERSLWAPLTLHATFNAFGLAMLVLVP